MPMCVCVCLIYFVYNSIYVYLNAVSAYIIYSKLKNKRQTFNYVNY